MSIVETIRNVPKLYHVKGCTDQQILEAEKDLNLKFSKEYIDYVKEFGAISFYGTEWTGLNIDGYLNVVQSTKQERDLNVSFPKDCYVIENEGIDGIIIASNENGTIYSIHYENVEKICNSLSEYLAECLKRSK